MGIRNALGDALGRVAARALMEGENYDTLWRRELYPGCARRS